MDEITVTGTTYLRRKTTVKEDLPARNDIPDERDYNERERTDGSDKREKRHTLKAQSGRRKAYQRTRHVT